MLCTNPDSVHITTATFDDLLGRALKIRDVTAGAAALLRDTAPSSALHELVAHARTAATAIVDILEREMHVSAERQRQHAQAPKHVGAER